MTTTRHTLPALWRTLLHNARRTGQKRQMDLRGGARLGVRVRDGWIILTIARKDKPVGDTELGTFRRICGVPATADRRPPHSQAVLVDEAGTTWQYLIYVWEDRPDDTCNHEATQTEADGIPDDDSAAA